MRLIKRHLILVALPLMLPACETPVIPPDAQTTLTDGIKYACEARATAIDAFNLAVETFPDKVPQNIRVTFGDGIRETNPICLTPDTPPALDTIARVAFDNAIVRLLGVQSQLPPVK